MSEKREPFTMDDLRELMKEAAAHGRSVRAEDYLALASPETLAELKMSMRAEAAMEEAKELDEEIKRVERSRKKGRL